MDKSRQKIQEMFSLIAPKYDLANFVLSFGIYKLWYGKLIKKLNLKQGDRLLDCATGTGYLAFRVDKYFKDKVEIEGIDFTQPMLDIANERKKKDQNIQFKFGDLMNLQYDDNSFDASSIAFGIRNVEDTETAIKEMARTVKSGGRVLILEFGSPKGLSAFFYKIYFNTIFIIFAFIFRFDTRSYKYLLMSSSEYPCREEFLKIMNQTGKFSDTTYETLSLGIAYIYCGIVK